MYAWCSVAALGSDMEVLRGLGKLDMHAKGNMNIYKMFALSWW